MSVDAAVTAAYQRLASRQADAVRAFVPGAAPLAGGDARDETTTFALDPLSVALPDRSYAIVRANDGRAAYTRDGSFRLENGVLCDALGNRVQGLRSDGTLGEIRLDTIDAAAGQTHDLRLDGDGTLSYERTTLDPRSGERSRRRVAAGRVALARFPAGSAVQSLDAIHVRTSTGIEPHVGAPADGTFGELAIHRRATSNIDIDAALVALKQAYLSLDALESARMAADGTVKGAMDLIK